MAHSIKRPDMIISPKSIQHSQKFGDHKKKASGADFDQLLQKEVQKQGGVKFSAHAAKRLESRQINLSENQHAKLNDAVDQAKDKGVKDSLILMNKLALVVNVKNRTVITAMDSSQMNGGMFTNIDGAMIINEK